MRMAPSEAVEKEADPEQEIEPDIQHGKGREDVESEQETERPRPPVAKYLAAADRQPAACLRSFQQRGDPDDGKERNQADQGLVGAKAFHLQAAFRRASKAGTT